MGRSITAHSANIHCRRQIEKSLLAPIEMSLSTVSVGEYWADDGDCDEPDGDRPDERVAGLAANRIKVADATALMGLGRRQVFRLAKAYGQHGPEALVSRRRGRPSNRCYPITLRAEVIGIIRERYSDFSPTLAAEKLAELHGIHLARETLRQWMMTAGLWKDRRARLRPVHQPRYRRDCVGELIQIDGLEHWWFEGRNAPCSSTLTMPPAG
jgi:hypothetical protein